MPWLAWIDEGRFDLRLIESAQNRVGNELRPIVRAQIPGRPVDAHQPRQHLNDPAGSNAARDVDRQTLAHPLIDEG